MTSGIATQAPVIRRSRDSWLLLRARLNRATMIGSLIVTAYVIAGAFPSLFTSFDPNAIDLSISLAGPSQAHLLGVDEFGRDVVTRILYGARLSLLVGFVSVTIGLAMGGTLGLLGGYYGGWIDTLIMRAMDILMSIPGIMLGIALVAALGPGMTNLSIAVGVYNIPSFARIARSRALSVREEEFISAARMVGARGSRIVARHLLPNSIGPLLVFGVLRFGEAILIGSGLSFLGLGVQPPTAEWGAMLAASRQYIGSAPHLVLSYGLSLSVLIFGLNAMGEGLRDAFDPTTIR